ncbi:MAG: hypothetical protein WCR55_14085 [Lentisphaerota bacterium]
MNAIEFETDIKDSIIRIPQRFKSFGSKHVKVILLSQDNKHKNIDTRNKLPEVFLMPLTVKTHIDFIRNDIYER